jgi:hypothetical protein
MLGIGCPIVFPHQGVKNYGIYNSKASCYAIALVQVLANIPAINVQYGALGEILRELIREKTGFTTALPARYINNVILETNTPMGEPDPNRPHPEYQLSEQQDPAEFLLRLLARYPLIKEITAGALTIYFANGNIQSMEDSIPFIPTPLNAPEPLAGAFVPDDTDIDRNLTPSWLIADKITLYKLAKLPPILVFQFLRFSYDKEKQIPMKIDEDLELPYIYDFKNHCVPELMEQRMAVNRMSNYVIHSVIEHIGGDGTANSGHYICVCQIFDGSGKCKLYDDARYEILQDSEQILGHLRKAYMAFYVRVGYLQYLFPNQTIHNDLPL